MIELQVRYRQHCERDVLASIISQLDAERTLAGYVSLESGARLRAVSSCKARSSVKTSWSSLTPGQSSRRLARGTFAGPARCWPCDNPGPSRSRAPRLQADG